MFQYVALTDGTTTIELTDMVSYALLGYAPGVAPLRDNQLGDSPYADTLDSLTFQAIGCTASEAYQAAGAVNALLDQARRWWKGENVSAVRIKMQPQNSSNSPLEALVKGRAIGGPANLQLEVTHQQNYGKFVSNTLSIQFLRRGQLLGTTDTAASASTNNGEIMDAAFGASWAALSPLQVELSGFSYSATPTIPTSVLMLTNSTAKLNAAPTPTAGVISGAGTATNFNDAGNFPVGGGTFVTRFSTTLNTVYAISGFGTLGTRQVFVATMRNNTPGVTWTITPSLVSQFGAGTSIGRTFTFSATTPTIVVIGVFVLPQLNSFFSSELRLSLTPSAAATLDLNNLVWMSLDDPYTSRMISIGATSLVNPGVSTTPQLISVDHRATSKPAPAVAMKQSGADLIDISRDGNPWLSHLGTQIRAVWLAPSGSSWRFRNATPATVANVLTANRRRAYLVPE